MVTIIGFELMNIAVESRNGSSPGTGFVNIRPRLCQVVQPESPRALSVEAQMIAAVVNTIAVSLVGRVWVIHIERLHSVSALPVLRLAARAPSGQPAFSKTILFVGSVLFLLVIGRC